MDGSAILAKVADLRLEGLLDGDEITYTLHAAIWADALRKDLSPRQVLDAIWEHLPSDEHWNGGLRELLDAALDRFDQGEKPDSDYQADAA